MWQTLQIDVQTINENTAVINLQGDVTGPAVPALKEAYDQVSVHRQSGNVVRNVILNFLDDHYIDSFGMTALVHIVTQARKQQQQLTLALSDGHTRRVLGLVGLNQYAKVYHNLDEALASLQ